MNLRAFHIQVVLFLLAFQAWPQQQNDTIVDLPQVVVSAQRLFVMETAGMKESRVDSVVMMHKSHMSLSDLLSENTPVFVRNHGRGALATASFRGSAASHTQVSWNGMPLNSPMAGMVDFSLIPVYIIDNVELQHGTASVASRSGGLGGAVHISNKAIWDDGFSASYTQGVGSYQTFDEFLDLRAAGKRLSARTRIYHNYSANNYTFINRNLAFIDPVSGLPVYPADTNRHAAYTRYGFLQELYHQSGSKQMLSLKWWAQWADRSIPRTTSYEGPDYANLSKQADHDNRIVADWQYYGNRSKLMVRSGFSSKTIDYRLDNSVPGFGNVPAIVTEGKEHSSLNHFSFSRDIARDMSWQLSLDANILQVNTHDSVTSTGYKHGRSELSSMAAFRKSFFNSLHINIMLRQDITAGKRSPLVPFAGFGFRPFAGHEFILRGHMARNHRQPSLNDLYWQPGGNPDLEAEQGVSMELGADYQIISNDYSVVAAVTLHQSDITNWIIWLPGIKGYWEPQNIRRVKVNGLELNLQHGSHIRNLSYKIHATYALNHSINYGDVAVWGDASYGKQLAFVPVHSGNVLLSVGYRRYSLSWQHNSYSERYTTSSNEPDQRNRLYPYYMNDVSLGRHIDIGKVSLSASLKVYNLFNETYRSVLNRPMPGRNYMVMVKVKV